MDLPGLDPALARRAAAAAAWLDERKVRDEVVSVIHHIDADGVTSGAIALAALERAGIRSRAVPAKSLDDVHIARIQGGDHDALWFCDFGSTAYMHFSDLPRLVCDHHQLVRDGTEEDFAHLNPLLDDIDGGTISGAGCAFLAALAHDPANRDLLPVALVGAAADLQDRHGGFEGTNAVLVAAGVHDGLLDVRDDLSWFGPETRPLRKFFAYAKEPAVPGITGDPRGAEAFLGDLDVPMMDAGRERTWSTLDDAERRRIRSGLVMRLLDCGLADRVGSLWRPVVRIAAEAPGTPMRELQEYGTLLNSTARYDEPGTGLAVARGDRGEALDHAMGLLQGHRQHLVKSLDAFRVAGVKDGDAIQWVHLRDHVRDTVVGIVCGMALDGLGLRRDRPLIGLAFTDDGRTKVSGRAPHEIQGRIDLATAMREASEPVGGQGGGHRGAAGATIPRDAEEGFLAALDAIVCQQLGIAQGGRTPDGGRGMGQVTSEHDAGAPVGRRDGDQAWQSPGSGQKRLF